MVLIISLLAGCSDHDAKEDKTLAPKAVHEFFNTVSADPVIIDDVKLGDSWRLIHMKETYRDGDIQKEDDLDLLDPKVGSYKEYWIFDKNQVLLSFSGDGFDKNWDGYYEKFNQEIDAENKIIRIDYVFDDGEKTYSIDWTIHTLTNTELILVNVENEEIYECTFRREMFK